MTKEKIDKLAKREASRFWFNEMSPHSCAHALSIADRLSRRLLAQTGSEFAARRAEKVFLRKLGVPDRPWHQRMARWIGSAWRWLLR